MFDSRLFLAATMALISVLPPGFCRAESGPPKGPRWTKNFWKAAFEAVNGDRPLVVLITRPNLPGKNQSEPALSDEEVALANPALAPAYGEVLWVDVRLSTTNDDEDSRAQERVALRLAWYDERNRVKLVFLNSETLRLSGNYDYEGGLWALPAEKPAGASGRVITLESFRRSVKKAKEDIAQYRAAFRNTNVGASLLQTFQAADQRAAKLEKSKRLGDIRKALRDDDWIVRYRAFQYLKKASPKTLLDEASALLALNAVPTRLTHHGYKFENHPFLKEILDFLEGSDSPAATEALNSWSDPERMKVCRDFHPQIISALDRRGNRQSLSILEPIATSGKPLDPLTMQSVDAAASIGRRDPQAKKAAIAVLKQAYPPPVGEDDPKGLSPFEAQRLRVETINLARKVHQYLQELSGKDVDFSGLYDAAARRKLMASW